MLVNLGVWGRICQLGAHNSRVRHVESPLEVTRLSRREGPLLERQRLQAP